LAPVGGGGRFEAGQLNARCSGEEVLDEGVAALQCRFRHWNGRRVFGGCGHGEFGAVGEQLGTGHLFGGGVGVDFLQEFRLEGDLDGDGFSAGGLLGAAAAALGGLPEGFAARGEGLHFAEGDALFQFSYDGVLFGQGQIEEGF
jgi:hypothetical protein